MKDKPIACGNCGGIIEDISTAIHMDKWSYHRDAYGCANSVYAPELTNIYSNTGKSRYRKLMKNYQKIGIVNRYYEA